jgi:uncharacterized damage-inducible protein DinB
VAVHFTVEELLGYSDHERGKRRQWIAAEPPRLDIPFQTETDRFPTIGSLFDHVFLVERRHLARLNGMTPPDNTGVAPSDWQALFNYGERVRTDLRRYVADLEDSRTTETMTFQVQTGVHSMTRRKLILHIVLHEIRHLAQAAYAARRVGQEPPGKHDLFYFTEFV